ncbi:hypothetical protein N7461_007637 [Penicillium sp. DV-2018c]|nr:hypothetical protein N7461_007637 [Penicillium sp. DV-2018c]
MLVSGVVVWKSRTITHRESVKGADVVAEVAVGGAEEARGLPGLESSVEDGKHRDEERGGGCARGGGI